MSTPIEKAVETVKRELPAIMKSMAQLSAIAMAGYVGSNFGERVPTEAYRAGTSDNPFDNSSRRNKTDVLRIASGRLFQSFTLSKPGNIFEITQSGNSVVLKYGTDVPYAAIHEYGGTINHPGGTPYKIINGRAVFISKAKGAGLKVTKPHTITMPARPYFEPAIEQFNAEFYPILSESITAEIIEAFNK